MRSKLHESLIVLGNVGIIYIKKFCVFRNSNVFLHDKTSGGCVRRRVESIYKSVESGYARKISAA